MYTATTTNGTNTINAASSDENAAITVLLNGTGHELGTAATWVDGGNTVVVTVANGEEVKTYTITVTKN